MKVVSIANQKGGTGKSTTAINLAEGLGRRSFRVLLGDLDEGQESSADWADINEKRNFHVKIVNPDKINHFIKRHEDDYDYLIFDCPPRGDSVAANIVRYSSLIIMPVAPSPIEIWGLRKLVYIIKDRQLLTDGIPAAKVLLSRCKKNTKLVAKTVRILKLLEIDLMESGTTELEVYRQVMEHGATVYDDPKKLGDPTMVNAPAIEQIDNIINEILGSDLK